MLPSSSHPLHTHFGRNNNQQPPNPAATTIFSYWSLIYLQPFQTQSANSPYPRRLLIHNPLLHNSAPLPALSGSVASKTRLGLDASVVLIMAVLICAIVCAIGLNTIVRCALQCSDRMAFLAYNSTRCDSSGGNKALKLLPSLTYSTSLKTTSTNSECAICLTEFKIGEQVRLLPKCKHSFHVKCIDQWLAAHPSCPNCRQCLSLGCHKSSQGMAGTGALQPLPLPPRSAIRPLHPEGALINYHLQRSILMS